MKIDAGSLNSVSMRGLKSTWKAMPSHTWNSSLTTVTINDQMFKMTFDKRQKCDKSMHMHTHTHLQTHTDTHTMFSFEERGKSRTWVKMDETGGHCKKWNELRTKRQNCIIFHVCSLIKRNSEKHRGQSSLPGTTGEGVGELCQRCSSRLDVEWISGEHHTVLRIWNLLSVCTSNLKAMYILIRYIAVLFSQWKPSCHTL